MLMNAPPGVVQRGVRFGDAQYKHLSRTSQPHIVTFISRNQGNI